MPTPNTQAGRRRARIATRVADRQEARLESRPHLQLGQNTGKNAFNVGGMPKPAPQVPNFLPLTPDYMHTQGQANDMLSAAEGAYGIANTLTPAQTRLQTERVNTDMGVAKSQLDEDLAERGMYDSGVRTTLTNRHIATPFGRQYQDIGFGAGSQYADAANQYGGAMLGYNQMLMDALGQRAADVYAAQPLGMPIGGYAVPDLPKPNLPGGKKGGGKKGGGKTKPRNRNGRRN